MNDGPKNEYLIVGLGNPGKKYAMSRHNVGFMAVDAIASYLKADFRASNSFSGEVAKFSDKKSGIDGYILKPTTFMNLSGEAVRPLADYYKIPPSNILVIFDDVDIPFGRVRIKANGSGGGHNGMLSIILNLNSDQFPRVRVGVGRPQNPERELADHVLSAFSAGEKKHLTDLMIEVVNLTSLFLEKGIVKVMNEYNGKDLLAPKE